jgi:hypothetical protein
MVLKKRSSLKTLNGATMPKCEFHERNIFKRWTLKDNGGKSVSKTLASKHSPGPKGSATTLPLKWNQA